MKFLLDATHKATAKAAPEDAGDVVWSMEDIAELVEAAAPKPGPRGPYKKRAV